MLALIPPRCVPSFESLAQVYVNVQFQVKPLRGRSSILRSLVGEGGIFQMITLDHWGGGGVHAEKLFPYKLHSVIQSSKDHKESIYGLTKPQQFIFILLTQISLV